MSQINAKDIKAIRHREVDPVAINNLRSLSDCVDSFIRGCYCPDLIIMNPGEWDWIKLVYGIEDLSLPKWMLYKSITVIFKASVDPGQVWMYRLEPEIELRQFVLSNPNLPIRMIFKFDQIMPDVVCNRPELNSV